MLGSKNSAKRKANAARRLVADRVRAVLTERFPKAFQQRKAPKIPLKIGIYDDVVAACPDLTGDDIKAALENYCKGPSYYFALAHGGPRFDLNGEEVGWVTDAQVIFAATCLLSLKHLPARFALKAPAPEEATL